MKNTENYFRENTASVSNKRESKEAAENRPDRKKTREDKKNPDIFNEQKGFFVSESLSYISDELIEEAEHMPKFKKNRMFSFKSFAAVAAVFIFIFSFAFLIMHFANDSENSQNKKAGLDNSSFNSEVHEVQIKDNRKNVLSDREAGSKNESGDINSENQKPSSSREDQSEKEPAEKASAEENESASADTLYSEPLVQESYSAEENQENQSESAALELPGDESQSDSNEIAICTDINLNTNAVGGRIEILHTNLSNDDPYLYDYRISDKNAGMLHRFFEELTFEDYTCDGIPDFMIIFDDGEEYSVNLGSPYNSYHSWVWKGLDKEAVLTPNQREALINLLIDG